MTSPKKTTIKSPSPSKAKVPLVVDLLVTIPPEQHAIIMATGEEEALFSDIEQVPEQQIREPVEEEHGEEEEEQPQEDEAIEE